FNQAENQTSNVSNRGTAKAAITNEVVPNAKSQMPNTSISKNTKIRVVGEIWCNYIIAELYSGEESLEILIIDKHAAHERIIYEKLKSKNNIISQFLMSPCTILNTDEEYAAICENLPLLKRLGFEFDLSNKPYISVLAVADYFAYIDVNDLMGDMLLDLLKGANFNSPERKIDDLLHTLACKAAVKSGDITGTKELQSLAEQAAYNPNIRHCPHGRPVMFGIKKTELEKQFRRRV
ncbi:MAG: DNA mismatch repair protein MutL, partial [Ruminococcus sp.]|nr:DNA mismatch repair protein MutL [Ruminococcus sp.]